MSTAGIAVGHGLQSVGCSVFHAAIEDPLRQYQHEIELTSKLPGKLGSIGTYVNCLRFPSKLKSTGKFDLTVLLRYSPFPNIINHTVLKKIRDRSVKMVYWAAGCDARMRRWGAQHNRRLCDPCLHYDQKSDTCRHAAPRAQSTVDSMIDLIDGVVPAAFEYQQSWKDSPKLMSAVPLAAPTIQEICDWNIKPSRFFHGKTRIGFKGSFVVEQAFETLRTHTSVSDKDNGWLFETAEAVPYVEYLSSLSRNQILVDQLFSRSLGINALLGLSMGMLVMVGDPKEAETVFGHDPAPVVRLTGSVEDLVEKSLEIISNPLSAQSLSQLGPAYVDEFHNPQTVAKRLIETVGY